MKIKYPKEWVKKKGRKNTYGNYAWGEYNYNRRTEERFEQTSNGDYICGYRQAIKDVKKLNPPK